MGALWAVADVPASLMALSQSLRPAPAARWSARTSGEALFVGGEIGVGLGAAVDRACVVRPDLHTVWLDSPGADVGQALHVDAERIWYPTLARLLAARVVTGTHLGSPGVLSAQNQAP